MAAELSFPKEKIRILLLENIHPRAVEELKASGYTQVETLKGSPKPEDLLAAIRNVHVLGIRSKTQLTPQVLAEAEKLLAVGAFCIGTDQIALKAAASQGICVFNSPYSSTRSVAELVIGATIILLRKLYAKAVAADKGIWAKTSDGCHELRGKVLGIVGYGHIGTQVSVMAEALGMRVQFYDILPKMALGNARACDTLKELLQTSDVVTLHVPEDSTTIGMMNAANLALMRPGAILINYARGKVIEVDAVADAVTSGHLGGVAVDVFANEPQKTGDSFTSPLQNLPNVMLSPHVGGSTEEAQENIGLDVAQKLVQFLDRGVSIGSRTLPELNLPLQAGAHRLLHIHRNVPGVASELNRSLADLGINITGQYLKTLDEIGYVVLDVEAGQTAAALDVIRQIPNTIKARSLY
jgi:D-3-phosphoglycerate dehydrogenase / 2-oxoglutarate reductase